MDLAWCRVVIQLGSLVTPPILFCPSIRKIKEGKTLWVVRSLDGGERGGLLARVGEGALLLCRLHIISKQWV